jgi:alanine dehydrogenase
MKNTIGVFRAGRSKRGEKRVAITPTTAKQIVDWGFKLIIQSGIHPETKEVKRAFNDSEYRKAGAIIQEDLSTADIIFGLKEIFHTRILPNKAYYFFSHTHKGQIKNRSMLKKLVKQKATVVDYELIIDQNNERLVTAFTYNAGYAGMVDSLWTLGKRLKVLGIKNQFELIPQAVEGQDLLSVKSIIHKLAKNIEKEGTTHQIPPIIVCFLGRGKTAFGAREIFNLLPFEEIKITDLESVYKNGSRKKLYALQIGMEDIYRLKKNIWMKPDEYGKLQKRGKRHFYLEHPNFFESNLDKILPYVTVLMNCIIWSHEYPRSITNKLMNEIWKQSKTLKVIGDITCDPNGSIEFSKETWIDDPVFIYNPVDRTIKDGFAGEGIAVMAVTNLPCEFSADASIQFSENLNPFLKSIIFADYKNDFKHSNLPEEIKQAVILWKGQFTKKYAYMKEYIKDLGPV